MDPHEPDVKLSFHKPRTTNGWDRLCRWIADRVDEAQASSQDSSDSPGYQNPETTDQLPEKDCSGTSSK